MNESVCNSKLSGFILSIGVSVKNRLTGAFVKISNHSTSNCECNRVCKIDENLDTKNCSRKERLVGMLVLACENKILNATEPSLIDKKVTPAKIIALLILFYC